MIWIILWLIMATFVAGKQFAEYQRAWPEWLAKSDKLGDFMFSVLFCGLIGWWFVIFILLFGRNPYSGERRWSYGWTLNYKNPRKEIKEER